MTEPTDIDLAAHAYTEAKAAEDHARAARIAAEEHLISLVGVKDEGTTSAKTAYYKVATVGKLTRTLNMEEAAMLEDELFQRITRIKHELDVRALKQLATADPDAYRAACRAVITKPAKASVKVDLIQQESNS